MLWTELAGDVDTPVSVMLKLGQERAYSALLESVEGGAIRGRYSLIGFKPDVIWRCDRGKAEINRQARQNQNSFEPVAGKAMDSLRALIRECRIDMPAELPPISPEAEHVGHHIDRQKQGCCPDWRDHQCQYRNAEHSDHRHATL